MRSGLATRALGVLALALAGVAAYWAAAWYAMRHQWIGQGTAADLFWAVVAAALVLAVAHRWRGAPVAALVVGALVAGLFHVGGPTVVKAKVTTWVDQAQQQTSGR